MKYPLSLEEAEATFGIERVKRHKTKQKESRRVKSISLHAVFCPDCGKLGYQTEEAARMIIRKMLDRGRLGDANAYSFHPYLCGHGWWHTGHNPRVIRIILHHCNPRH
jgi:hypothetical protein